MIEGRVGVFALALAVVFCAAFAAEGAVIQENGVRVTVRAQVKPYKLPRFGFAPIALFVAGHLATPSGAIPPQLRRLDIEVNRNGVLRNHGLPSCGISALRTASTARALSSCRRSLIGSGQFWAHIVLPGQRPYPTRGRLLVFNGRRGGRSVLLTHIFTANPFASSFVIVFAISHRHEGNFGTRLSASLPQALGDWGYVDRIKLTLRRKYRVAGRSRSYFNAGCPAPSGTRGTVFRLARASFSFGDRPPIDLTVSKSCGVTQRKRMGS